MKVVRDGMLGTKETRAVRSRRIKILQEYNVLNLAQDDVLDDILQLAIHIGQASRAAIAFVDTDEQWLKAAVGFKIESLPVDATVRTLFSKDIQTFHPLHNSLIASNVLLQKFPECQSGLSLLLKTQNGYPLGYLMVLRAEDRPFTDAQISMMQVLTRQIMAEVTLKVSQKVHAKMVVDLQLLHQELQMAKDLAEASDQRKSRVLA